MNSESSLADHAFDVIGEQAAFLTASAGAGAIATFTGIARATALDGVAVDALHLDKGLPRPKGALFTPEGINFALFTRHAERVTLVLQLGDGPCKGSNKRIELPLDPRINKTGDIWHVMVQGLPAGCSGTDTGWPAPVIHGAAAIILLNATSSLIPTPGRCAPLPGGLPETASAASPAA